jgi:hypothetical protein
MKKWCYIPRAYRTLPSSRTAPVVGQVWLSSIYFEDLRETHIVVPSGTKVIITEMAPAPAGPGGQGMIEFVDLQNRQFCTHLKDFLQGYSLAE